jgi:hypothetical protein
MARLEAILYGSMCPLHDMYCQEPQPSPVDALVALRGLHMERGRDPLVCQERWELVKVWHPAGGPVTEVRSRPFAGDTAKGSS